MGRATLVIMAAGIGSRFGGGIKQLEPVGPNGEIIMDYSIKDAMAAGFDKVVFVIRKDIEKDFREIIGDRIEKIIPVDYAFQSVDDLPGDFTNTWQRTKPWGTGQAVLCIKGKVHEPFAVINADDYYGKEAFVKLYDYMTGSMDIERDPYDICMAGFMLDNTLSENGGVTRGVCDVDSDGVLRKVTETYEIVRSDGILKAKDEAGNDIIVPEGMHVSMNMWGLPPKFLDELESGFVEFLQNTDSEDKKSEYLLPKIIDKLIQENRAQVKLLETRDKWFGVTYKKDKPVVVAAIRKLIENGEYK